MITSLHSWTGTGNSFLFLCLNENEGQKPFLTIEYASSLVGNHFESGQRFFPVDLESPDSELMKILQEEFPENCLKELKYELGKMI